jgi:enamine deaminase RidA (YjgF/YER057c/UK114 family)
MALTVDPYAHRMSARAKLVELGITLPSVPPPVGSYVPVAVTGNLAFVSGQIARKEGHVIFKGKVGEMVSVEQGASAAREATILALAALDAEGLLDRVARVVKVTGYVASAPGFADHPKVVNGASDLLVQVFGEAGRHARTSVGVAALPLGASVEVEFVFELR